MAEFGWIDFSKEHRDVLKSVLDALQQKGVVDELGIGTIRNHISDLLFPGISTIQTRARYFILIPKIIQEYEQKYYKNETGLGSLQTFLRNQENKLMHSLASKYAEGDGIIGISVAKLKGELSRKPSSIYWNGLRKHNIINTSNSLSEYLKCFEYNYRTNKSEKDDSSADFNDLFGINLPKFNFEMDENVTIDLTKQEAEFLKDQFTDNSHKAAENLLSEVLLKEELMALFVDSVSFRDMAIKLLETNLPVQTKKNIQLGEQFDFIIQGAHIRYNCLLNPRVTDFIAKWNEWLSAVETKKEIIQKFDVEYLLLIAESTKSYTKSFVLQWIENLSKTDIDIPTLDELIISQERKNKKSLAKLSISDPDVEHKWVGMGSGDESLNYRFFNARRIVEDIYNGLKL